MTKHSHPLFRPIKLKPYLVCALMGASSGLLVALFLISLQWITEQRQAQPLWIWALPLVGLATPFLYKSFGFGAEKGIKLVLEEIHRPQQLAPLSMAPLIYITTLLSHLVGASVGREGTALQMAAAVGDRIATFMKVNLQERRWVLMAALSAGFSAALGAPWAGTIFGLEVIVAGHIDRRVLIECFIASFVAWMVSVGMNAPHFEPIAITPPTLSLALLGSLLVLAVSLGITSRLHVFVVHQFEKIFGFIPALWRTFAGGLLLLGLLLLFPLDQYQGLGLERIHEAFHVAPSFEVPWIKLLLTAIALAVGFKGGEFVPLVFAGCTLASFIAGELNQPLALFAGMGFVSLFAAAAKTPWTCTIMAMEYFGWEVAPFAALVTVLATVVAGPKGIYPGQRQHL